MTKRLEGKVAIVTGSGQGVGRGIAIVLAREGAKVVTNNRKPRSSNVKDFNAAIDPNMSEVDRQKLFSLQGDAESTANKIIAEGGEAVSFYGNVADFDTAGKLIQKAIDAFGRIDILVNNAAGLGTGALATSTEADWDYLTVPKLKGAFNCIRHAVPYMIKQKFGRIVNVASDAWVGMAGISAYSAANAGLVGLTKATAKELYKLGVTVNAICPQAASPGHFVEFNAMFKKLKALGVKIDPERMKKVEDDHGPAENMAPFVAYLATEEATYISASVFSITASGRVTLYSDPAPTQTIRKDDSPWTVEELIKVAPEKLLKNYVSIATISDFA
ncbi:MAG: SDR family oxidoreductase [Anaerolineales bacterium]|nr:SDR family oxidoreductase [Anaerolineales bacterium]